MPIDEGEWTSIRALIDRVVSTRAESFVTCKVTKVDRTKKVIFTKEFGVQPIPIVTFAIEVFYYDTQPTGTIIKKPAKVSLQIPEKDDIVLIAREMGTHRLPRCLGVLISNDWILTGDDD